MLTPELYAKAMKIIERHHAAVVLAAFGPEALPADVVADLKAAGLYDGDAAAETMRNAYLYGQLAAKLEDPALATWSWEQVEAHLKKHPITLSATEEAAVKTATLSAAHYVRGLGNTVQKDTGAILIEADHALRAHLVGTIQTETAANIQKRETVKELKSKLGWATQDWTRNLDRIAITEKHNAMQTGFADGVKARHGPKARVAFLAMPDACGHCRRLHIGPDGAPRIFVLDTLPPAGANVGKKASAWTASQGAVHPHCQCQMIRIPVGWGFDETGTLVPGGEFGIEYADEEEAEKSSRREAAHLDVLEKAYRLEGRLDFQGLDISIETGAGNLRFWKDRNGESGATVMAWPYGYIRNTEGVDGDHVDCYVGPDPDAPFAYVVHQRKKMGEGRFEGYDEDKVMLGFPSAAAAKQGYLAHYNDPGFFGSMTRLTIDELKARLAETRAKPQKLVKSLDDVFVLLERPLEELYPDEFALEKAGPHKYTSKKWVHGQWVYTYAEEQGGKVRPHFTDEDKVALKLPKEKLGQLEAFRAKHNLPGKVILGGNYAILVVSEADSLAVSQKLEALKQASSPKLTIADSGKLWEGRKKFSAKELSAIPVGTEVKAYYGEKGFAYVKGPKGWLPKLAPDDVPMNDSTMASLPDTFEHVVPAAPPAPPPAPAPAPAPEPEPAAATPAPASGPPTWTAVPAAAPTPEAEQAAVDEAAKVVEDTPVADDAPTQAGAKPTEEELSKQKAWAYGQHIFGSVKDKVDAAKMLQSGKVDVSELSNAEAALVVNKASLMPALNAETMKSFGASPGGAHLALQIAALVAPKPGADSAAARAAYARGVKLVAASVQKIKTVEDAEEFRHSLKTLAGGMVELVDTYDTEDDAYAAAAQLQADAPEGVTYKVSTRLEAGKYGSVVDRVDTRQQEDIRALGTRFLTQLGIGRYSKYGTFYPESPYHDGAGKIYWEARKLAKAAEKMPGDDGWAHIGAKLDEKKEKAKGKKGGEPKWKWRASVSDKPDLTGTKVVVEEGSRERFGEVFGFKGVQRGESLPDKDLEHHLRHAEMAFHDLADVVGLSPEQISLQGRLSIAFGARGKGGARAHYEPATKAINLTRFAGAGSLAHEWGHFMDNIVAETSGAAAVGQVGAFATTSKALPPDIKQAVAGVMSAIESAVDPATQKAKLQAHKDAKKAEMEAARTEYFALREKWKQAGEFSKLTAAEAMEKQRVAVNDLVAEYNQINVSHGSRSSFVYDAMQFDSSGSKKKSYMSLPEELFARAFESYVQDKLEDNGRRNSYLVDGTRKFYETPHHNPFTGKPCQPYPQGEERKRIHAAMEKLLDVLRTGKHLEKALARMLVVERLERLEKSSARSVMVATGTGPNLQVDGKQKQKNLLGGDHDIAGHVKFLFTEPEMHVVVRRDPTEYEVLEGMRWKQPITLDGNMQMYVEENPDPEQQRADVEHRAAARLSAPRNLVEPRHTKTGPMEHQGARVRKAVELFTIEKGGPFFGPKGGKWADAAHTIPWKEPSSSVAKPLLEAVQHLGGKVVAHLQDASKVVLKVPKAKVAALQALKVAHGLTGDVIEGGHYALLAVPAGAGKVAAGPKKATQQPVAPKPKPPAAAPKADISDMPTKPISEMQAPPKAGWQLTRGQKVGLKGQTGTVQGWDYKGRMVINVGGKRRVAGFEELEVGQKQEHTSSFQKLKPGTVREPTAQQKKLVQTVLQTKVGKATAAAHADWLVQRGHEVYLVGGIVRDMVALTAPGTAHGDAVILEAMNDVDFVSSAPPDTLRRVLSVVGDSPATATGDTFAMKGCVTNGKLDFASLSSGGVYDKKQHIPDTGAFEVPSQFDHDMDEDASRRDFTANALYYDVHNEAIVDPTGHGLSDARAMVLRKPEGTTWAKNDKLAIRFWKFRSRGWTGEPATTKAILELAKKELGGMADSKRARYLAKQIYANASTPAAALKKLRDVMHADGAGDLYAKYVWPIEGEVKAIIAAKQKGG